MNEMNQMEQKLTMLLINCGVTFCARGKAQALIEAGVKVDPDSKHCYQCKHFIGGGDWSLCCRLKDDLCYKNTIACKNFEEKE